MLAFAREGYHHTDFRLRDTLETLFIGILALPSSLPLDVLA